MNPQQKTSFDPAVPYPGPDLQDAQNERPIAIGQEIPPAGVSEPASTKSPTLLDTFYYWVMSR